jgi:chorismate mutase
MNEEIKKLRREIDSIDEKIISCLGQRKKIIKKIGQLKHTGNIKIYNAGREKEIKSRIKKIAKKEGIDELVALKLYSIILINSREEQENANIR